MCRYCGYILLHKMLYLLYQTPKFLTIHYAIINQRKCLDFWILTTRNCSFDFLLFNIYCSYVLMFSCWGRRKRRKEQCGLICCPREKRNNLMTLFLHTSDRTSSTYIHHNFARLFICNCQIVITQINATRLAVDRVKPWLTKMVNSSSSNTMIRIGNLDLGHLIDTQNYLTTPTPKSSRFLITFSWIM